MDFIYFLAAWGALWVIIGIVAIIATYHYSNHN